jgi:hypothetical protein
VQKAALRENYKDIYRVQSADAKGDRE